ncbi:MAG: hypothetical protein ABSE44_15050 [Candidatus Sulfotelmatobacter sp.]|jgi:hypothetical protein
MFDLQPEKTPRSTLEVVLGCLLGVLISLGCLFFSIFLGMNLGQGHRWLFPVLNAAALAVAGIVALRQMRDSSYALGVVIALSLAFLLNTACGVAFFR